MATNAKWTVVFEDKTIINQSVKNSTNFGTAYTIDDDSFWNQEKFSNVWAIQYHDDDLDHNDTVEHRDNTPHATWNNSNLGNFQDFITKWDAAHLLQLQNDWDNDDGNTYDDSGNLTHTETEAEKIIRLGARPTSYSS